MLFQLLPAGAPLAVKVGERVGQPAALAEPYELAIPVKVHGFDVHLAYPEKMGMPRVNQ